MDPGALNGFFILSVLIIQGSTLVTNWYRTATELFTTSQIVCQSIFNKPNYLLQARLFATSQSIYHEPACLLRARLFAKNQSICYEPSGSLRSFCPLRSSLQLWGFIPNCRFEGTKRLQIYSGVIDLFGNQLSNQW